MYKLAIAVCCSFLLSADLYAAPQPSLESINLNEEGAKKLVAKDYEQARFMFEKALAADKSNTTAAYNLAGTLMTQNKMPLALSVLTDYTQRFPQDTGLMTRLGDAHFANKDLNSAEKSYLKTVALDSKYAGVYKKLGDIYVLKRRLVDAEKMYLKAVEQDPKDEQLLSNLSSIFLANNKLDQSISTARRGLQVKPDPELYITLGTAYEMKQDFKNSLIALKRAQDLGSTNKDLKLKIEEMEKRQG